MDALLSIATGWFSYIFLIASLMLLVVEISSLFGEFCVMLPLLGNILTVIVICSALVLVMNK